MPSRYITRQATARGAQGLPTACPIYCDSDDNKLKMIPAGSGTTEVEIVDASSTQTLTGKTVVGTVTTLAGDGAVAVGSDVTIFTKGSAAAVTLAAPATIGQKIELYAGSAFAHVVTATGLIDDGITGGSKTTLTFGAFVGASITLRCVQAGKWAVQSKNVVTIT